MLMPKELGARSWELGAGSWDPGWTYHDLPINIYLPIYLS
jgi:hypothetical protein